ncbi:MAG TPA: recombinase A [Kofleriaceae bacterium]|jgi:recombination protein RecA|nr:recombinase A [Kofleriaceae bacterium]
MSDLDRFLANARGSLAQTAKVVRLGDLETREHSIDAWSFAAARGRFVELSARGATATLTAATELVVEAQLQGEPVAWLAPWSSTFYPPDVAASGVDLAALVVIRVGDALGAARSAERLLRSGAFGLVILELGSQDAELAMAVQGRLVTLAQTHDAAVVCLTEKSAETASLGSLISLRTEATRLRDEVVLRVIKDKRRGPGAMRTIKRGGPAGLLYDEAAKIKLVTDE